MPITQVLTRLLKQASTADAQVEPGLPTRNTEQLSGPITKVISGSDVTEPGLIPQTPHIVFRAAPAATRPEVINQIERRARIVFLLLDGKRSIREIARLVHRNELDVAHTIATLLRMGYVEHL